MSGHLRALALGTILPTSFILLAITLDFTASISPPKPFRDTIRRLRTPFTNFIHPEDVMYPLNFSEARRFVSKTRILSGLAFLAGTGWLGWLVYGAFLEKTTLTLRALVALVAWVRFSLLGRNGIVDRYPRNRVMFLSSYISGHLQRHHIYLSCFLLLIFCSHSSSLVLMLSKTKELQVILYLTLLV